MHDAGLVYWDACVFVDLLNEDPDHCQTITTLLEQFEEQGRGRVVTSTITKVEAAFTAAERAGRVLDEDVIAAMDHLWEANPVIDIVEFHDEIATLARDLIRDAMSRSWGLTPIDAIHLATAQWYKVHEFHTYDGGLEKYSENIGFQVCEPYVLQSKLPNL